MSTTLSAYTFCKPGRTPSKWLRHATGAGAIAVLLGTAACSPQYDPFNPAFDPLVREGLYQPGHTNHNNLTLMVANPSDLVRGTGATTSDGQQATAAIERYRNDKVKKLPQADLAQVSSGENNTSGGSGGGGAGGQ
jgi:type IV pilus biogenesis protein CpaD/CtpE